MNQWALAGTPARIVSVKLFHQSVHYSFQANREMSPRRSMRKVNCRHLDVAPSLYSRVMIFFFRDRLKGQCNGNEHRSHGQLNCMLLTLPHQSNPRRQTLAGYYQNATPDLCENLSGNLGSLLILLTDGWGGVVTEWGSVSSRISGSGSLSYILSIVSIHFQVKCFILVFPDSWFLLTDPTCDYVWFFFILIMKTWEKLNDRLWSF